MLHVLLNVFFLAQIRFLQNLQLRFTVFDLREKVGTETCILPACICLQSTTHPRPVCIRR
jgi:hypothetical protein